MRRRLCAFSVCFALPLFAFQLATDELPSVWSTGERPTAWAKDEVYVLEFWATWCGPCRKAMPHMEAIWQAGKAEGIHVIGINTGEQRTLTQVMDVIAKQPTPPTYPIALDREEGLSQKMGVKGIPHTSVLVNGQEVWKGHPAHLSIEALRVLRRTGKMPTGEQLKVQAAEHPYQAMIDFEKAADAAAAKGNWDEAVSLQRQALLAHPLQERLEKRFLPALLPRLNTHVVSDAPKTFTSEALQIALPADVETLTVVSLWVYPWWKKQLTQETIQLMPGEREAHTFTAPYRSITLVDVTAQKATQDLLKHVPDLDTDIRFVKVINKDAFKVDEKYKYPFVLVYLGGELLYGGALEAMPKTLRGPIRSVNAYRKAIEEERALATQSKAIFLALRNGKTEPALNTKMTSGYASLALPYLFAEPYRQGDVAAGVARLNQVMSVYGDDPGVLETMLKLLDTWQELIDATWSQQETISLYLAEQNPKIAPSYAVGHYVHAAECAQKQGATARSQDYLRRALGCCAQAKRLDAFQRRIQPLPTY